jgi:hypothetical protein
VRELRFRDGIMKAETDLSAEANRFRQSVTR